MQDLTFREARPEDAEVIFALNQALKSENLYIVNEGLPNSANDERSYLEYALPERTLFLLAFRDKELVGYTLCNIGTFKVNKHTADMGISVKSGHRDKGIGTHLMTQTFERLKKKGVSKVTLSVFSVNLRAIQFYKRLGFIEEGTRRQQWLFQGKLIDELQMAKWI
jgi:ribosomal protein S18 acetylase RimI-like enzyme